MKGKTTKIRPNTEAGIRRFLTELGQILLRTNTPAHRVEGTLNRMAQRLGIDGRFFATPSAVFISVGEAGRERAGFARCTTTIHDLGMMHDIDGCVKSMVDGQLGVVKGLERLKKIQKRSRPYPPWLTILAFAMSAGLSTPFFGGGLREGVISAGVGALLGVMEALIHRSRFAPLWVFMAAALAALCAHLFAQMGGIDPNIVLLSSLLYLLPGLTLTVALMEVSTGHLVSGSSRGFLAGLVFLQLAFGAVLGAELARVLPVEGLSLSWGDWGGAIPKVPALIFSSIAFGILLKARPKDLIFVVLAGATAYGVSRFVTIQGSAVIGAFAGAIAVGILSNAYAQFLDRPAVVLSVPGILFLVPGSIGFRGLSFAASHETLAAMGAIFEMLFVAVALVSGLLVAHALLSPRRQL